MQKSRIHQHLVKPLAWRQGPEGLYPFELFWMEGNKDMEGWRLFRVLFHKGGDAVPSRRGHGRPSVRRESWYLLRRTQMILSTSAQRSPLRSARERNCTRSTRITPYASPGTPSRPRKGRNVKRPFAHFVLSLDPVYSGELIPESALKPPVPGSSKYDGYARIFATNVDQRQASTEAPKCAFARQVPGRAGDHSRAAGQKRDGLHKHDRRARRDALQERGEMGPGNADNLVWLYGNDLQNFELNFLWGHYTGTGVWHRAGESLQPPE